MPSQAAGFAREVGCTAARPGKGPEMMSDSQEKNR